jgi:hypothetical protein
VPGVDPEVIAQMQKKLDELSERNAALEAQVAGKVEVPPSQPKATPASVRR